ncbi:MAG: ABC transporter permease [Bacteroidales bacterium]|nr:ABC transporter permease [Bacteroidales bacterium]
MNKILLIINREYLSSVKKKSFVIMTILGPILMAAIFVLPVYIGQLSDENKTIAVVDESELFYKRLPDGDNLKFVYLNENIASAKAGLDKSAYYAILHIPFDTLNPVIPSSFILISPKQPGMMIKSYIENALKKDIEEIKLKKSGIDEKTLKSIDTEVNLTTVKLKETGDEEKSYSEISSIIGLFAGIMIYFFIFLYGALVMRGVIEEKTNRIVEVIISSVKPFQLMMGKIIGVAMVGLTQFLLWIILTLSIITTVKTAFPDIFKQDKTNQLITANSKMPVESNLSVQKAANDDIEINSVLESVKSVNYTVMILAFLFYFLGGYLLYAALFAAIGAAVDNETDSQQFTLPITIPLIFAIVMMQFIINNPEGPVSFWLSMIPLTSPVIMMIRIPFGVPYWEVLLSGFILIISFIAATWLAAKIYKTGILMYGKNVNYRELWKWLKYSR